MKDNVFNKKLKYVYWDVCTWIAVACVVVYMLTNFANIRIKGLPLVYWVSLIPGLVRYGFVWQFVTYMFVHGSPLHLLLNMYALFVFGKNFERNFGSLEFLLFYFLTGILGGLISYLIYLFTGMGNVAVMGASGAIYALLFIEAVMYPKLRILLFMFIPVTLPVAMIIFILVELVCQFTGGGQGVAHLVHLSSIAIAWIYCIVRFRLSPWKVWKENL